MNRQLITVGQVDLPVLAVIAQGPIHGYALIEALRQRSGGVFDLPEGTVYPALYRLQRMGLIRSRTVTVDSRKRRLYELTKKGRKAIEERSRAWYKLAIGMSA